MNELVALIEQANSEVLGKGLTDAEAIAAKASIRLSKEQFLSSIEAVERVLIKEYERILKIAGNESQAMKVFANLKQKKNFYDCFGIARDALNLATWFRNQSRKIKRILLSKIHLLSKTNLKRIIKLSSEDLLDFLHKLKTKTLQALDGTLGEKATKHKRIEYLLDGYQNTHIFLEDLLQEKHWDLAKSKLETKHKKIARNFNWDEIKEKVFELSEDNAKGQDLLQILMEIDDPAIPSGYFKSLFKRRIKEGSKNKKASKESAEIERLNGELAQREDRIKELGIDLKSLEKEYNILDEQNKQRTTEYERKIAQMQENYGRDVRKLLEQCNKQLEEIERLKQDNQQLRSEFSVLKAQVDQKINNQPKPPRNAESAAGNKGLGVDYKVKVIEQASNQYGEIGDIVAGDRITGWLVSFPMPEDQAGPAIHILFAEDKLEKIDRTELVVVSGSKEADPSRGTGFGSLIKNSNNNTARSA